jgi:putative SOS response-associated peptidase YedK
VCGRFTSSQRREAVGERFKVAVPEAHQHRFNLAPQQRALIVRQRDDERDAVMARWGLLPHWAKDSKVAFKMINARAETLTEKPAYRSLIGKYRCLIPADGFYEWTGRQTDLKLTHGRFRPRKGARPSRRTANLRGPGRLAQLGEHQLDKLGVTGSSPVPPTNRNPR